MQRDTRRRAAGSFVFCRLGLFDTCPQDVAVRRVVSTRGQVSNKPKRALLLGRRRRQAGILGIAVGPDSTARRLA